MTCITPLEAFLLAVLALVLGGVAGLVLGATLSVFANSHERRERKL